jgi:glycosyltransferase involved in cell wall biosynthesis
MKVPLSVVVIAKNEEKNIARCLSSVQWAEEILVIDSHSQDQTCVLANGLGARVVTQDWLGFGAQKDFGARQARFNWILSLDADEVVTAELQKEILNRWSSLDPKAAYSVCRKSFHLGRWIEHGGWFPDRQVRLFNRQYSYWDLAPIHEKVVAKINLQLGTSAHLEHYLFENLADQVTTNNRYSGLLAQQDAQKGRKFSLLKLLFKPGIKFLECYLLKRGFLDGLPGFIIAWGAAHSIFMRQAKLWEMQR